MAHFEPTAGPYPLEVYRAEKQQLLTELLAGLTVAFAQVPESVAFGFVAGVSPSVALHASWVRKNFRCLKKPRQKKKKKKKKETAVDSFYSIIFIYLFSFFLSFFFLKINKINIDLWIDNGAVLRVACVNRRSIRRSRSCASRPVAGARIGFASLYCIVGRLLGNCVGRVARGQACAPTANHCVARIFGLFSFHLSISTFLNDSIFNLKSITSC